MGEIIKSEVKKVFKSRKNKLLIGLIIVLLIGINIWSKWQKDNFYDNEIERLTLPYNIARGQVKNIQNILEAFRIQEEELDLDLSEEQKTKKEKEKAELNEKLKFFNDEASRINMVLSVLKNASKLEDPSLSERQRSGLPYTEEEQKEYYIRYLISLYNNNIESYEKGYTTSELLKLRGTSLSDIKRELFVLNYLQQEGIDYEINPYTNTGVDSVMTLFNNNFIIITFIILVFLFIDIFLSEVEEGSYKLLYTQPYERKDVFLGKIISIFLMTALIFFIMFGVQFLVGTVFNGIGDFSAPYAASENLMKLSLSNEEIKLQIIPIGKNIILSILSIMVILLLSTSIIGALSIYTDSIAKTISVEIVLILLTIIIRNFIPMSQIVHGLNPFSYLFTQDILTGRINGNYLLGILLNIGLSIILFLLSYQKFNKKDFLGAKG